MGGDYSYNQEASDIDAYIIDTYTPLPLFTNHSSTSTQTFFSSVASALVHQVVS